MCSKEALSRYLTYSSLRPLTPPPPPRAWEILHYSREQGDGMTDWLEDRESEHSRLLSLSPPLPLLLLLLLPAKHRTKIGDARAGHSVDDLSAFSSTSSYPQSTQQQQSIAQASKRTPLPVHTHRSLLIKANPMHAAAVNCHVLSVGCLVCSRLNRGQGHGRHMSSIATAPPNNDKETLEKDLLFRIERRVNTFFKTPLSSFLPLTILSYTYTYTHIEDFPSRVQLHGT